MSDDARDITADLAREFAYADVDEDVWKIVEDDMVDQTRWHTHYRKVLHDLAEDTYWEFRHSMASTENGDDPDIPTRMRQVYPKSVVKTIYTRKA